MTPARVLLVDDEVPLRQALAEMLTFDGIDVVEAGSAREAERLFEPRAFDVVVTDLRLPDESGIEMLGRLRRADPAFAAVVTTGYGSFDDAVAAIGHRVSAFLTKPFSLADLAAAIREASPGAPAGEAEPCDATGRWSAHSARAAELLGSLEAHLRESGVDRCTSARALSLAEEAIVNCHRHAYGTAGGPVTLACGVDDGSLVVSIADSGSGLDLTTAVRRGAGVIRFYREADEVSIRPHGKRGTVVRLRFRGARTRAHAVLEPHDDAVATSILWS